MDQTNSDGAMPQSGRAIARGGRSRAWRAVGLIGASAAGFIGLLAVCGVAYEHLAGVGDTARYSLAGRIVDVGGYRLHIDCRGSGSPVVVMDAGLGGSSLDWTLVQPELATTTRVCTYDRAGMGWSDAGPEPRSPAQLARELHALLSNAGIPQPYVLVAHSLAGKNARLFASAYPQEVAGMVLVDARSERVDALTSTEETAAFYAALQGEATMFSIARQLGLARLFGAGLIGEPLLSSATATEMALLQTAPNAIEETTREGLARSADDTKLTDTTLGSIPLVVIAADDSMTKLPNWAAAQRALAALSTDGRLVVAQGSSHAVQLEQPDVVIDGVREVVASVRSKP